MCSGEDKCLNLDKSEYLIEKAALEKAQLISLPENFAFFGQSPEQIIPEAEMLDGQTINRLKKCAKKNHIWLSLGGFQEKIPGENKIYNSHIVINNSGDLVAVYRKIHLFLANLPEGNYDEAQIIKNGNQAIIVKTPAYNLGLSICFDLRFPHLFSRLRTMGADVLLIPAAFTCATGRAHWEVLLRARAIENQSYVIAAAQGGQNNAKRATYGHAMIIDPWGSILAHCQSDNDLAIASIDIDLVKKIREQMPLRPKTFLTDE
jgi:predicted amidohydrolase